jgi:hypothetical protein
MRRCSRGSYTFEKQNFRARPQVIKDTSRQHNHIGYPLSLSEPKRSGEVRCPDTAGLYHR